ncbi:MAG TPA: hypothetical protein VMT03_25660 [Polyangia bacterium]|nr:hypothetical protein [Polyangia bacterium]
MLGPAADAFLLGPGATLLLGLPLLLSKRAGGASWAVAEPIMVGLIFLCVGPHYAATYRRAYTSTDVIRDHPWVTIAAPLALLVVAAGAMLRPTTIGVAFFAVYVCWSGYHYSGQSIGLAMLYPLRQGARLDPREKRLLKLPLYVSWILSLIGFFRLSMPARSAAHELVRRAYTSAGASVPTWLIGAGLAALAASFLGVARVARERRLRGTPLPWPTYAVLSAQVTWFTVGLFEPLFAITLVPVFHSLQYVALTSWHACHGQPAGPKLFARYAVVILLLGLAINPGVFLLAGHYGLAGDTLVASAAIMSFVNLHHFLLDGRIWRLRERRVVQSMVA